MAEVLLRMTPRLPRNLPSPAVPVLITLLVAWGAFAFGAVYAWSYIPLGAGAAAVGVWGVWRYGTRHRRLASARSGIVTGLTACAAAGALQLLPMPASMLAALSPNAHRLLRSFDLPYAVGAPPFHPLSIDPGATLIALAMLLSLTVFLAGATRAMSANGVATIAIGIGIAGTLVAVVGIIQRPLYGGLIYGFWKPQMEGGNPFGPFVNKNHFAGWMMMALSLTLGYLCGRLVVALRSVKPGLHNRIVWLGSADASQIVLLAGAVLVMALAQVLTFSRSGILCLFASVGVTGWFVAHRRHAAGRVALRAYLVLVIVATVGWTGIDAVGGRFREAVNGYAIHRMEPWLDAMSVSRAFAPFGSGLNTYGTATLFYQTHDRSVHYAEAHNDYLQLLAEGGLLVGIPAIIAAVIAIRTIRRRFREGGDDTIASWTRAGAVAGLAAIALQEFVDFSLQIPANAVLFAVLLAVATHRAARMAGPVRA